MKRIRRRTRNRIIGVVSTLSVLVLGVIMVTVFTKADSSEFDKFVVADAQNYGIIAYESMEEGYKHSASNFATMSYNQGPSTSTGYDKGDLNTSILVGNIASDSRFSLNQPGTTTVYGPEDIEEIVHAGGGSDADLTNVNDPTKVTFVGETREEIEAQIARYVSEAREYGESVVYEQSEGAVLGFLDSEVETEPVAPEVVEKPTIPEEPKKPSRIDELEQEIGSMSDEDLKKFTESSDYVKKVAESVSGGSVEADFVSLVEEYYKAWGEWEEEYAQYKEDVKQYKADLKAYNKYLKAYKKYERDLAIWNDESKTSIYTKNLNDLMLKHHYGTKIDLDPTDNERKEMVDPNFGDGGLKNVVIVDVLECEGTVAYVDMDPFFNSDADERLWYGRENCVEIRIYKRTGQTIVFNSSDSSTVSDKPGLSGGAHQKFIPAFYIVETTQLPDGTYKDGATHQGGQGYGDDAETAKSIIWNFTSSDEILLKSNNIRSTIIAPDSTVNLGCEKMCGKGWIICNKYYSLSEWYYVGKRIQTPPPSNTPATTTKPPKKSTTPPTDTPPVETATTPPTDTPPVETTTPPTDTPPVETTTPPTDTPPVETTTPPTNTPPVQTTTPPVQTTTPPVETTTPPVQTTTPPVQTTTPPVTTTRPPVITLPPTNAPTSTPIRIAEVPPAAPETTPTATPLTVIEQTIPLSAATQAPDTELPPQDVPLSKISTQTKPKDKTETIIEPKVPLAATVPETGDSMNPIVPIAGMGLSILVICGIFVIRKKLH